MAIIKDISHLTRIPERTLYNWKDNGIFSLSDNQEMILAKIVNHLRKENTELKKPKADKDPLREQKIRLTRENADKLEIENQFARGELLLEQEVKKEWLKISALIKAKLLNLPNKLALDLSLVQDPLEIETIIRDAIFTALTAIADAE